MDYRERYESWLSDPYFDEATKEELRAIEGDDQEIEERFYKDLEFGTAGLRGVIGAGTNRLNIYTVRKATQGMANYIIKNNGQDRGVAIAHDSRHMSPEFADEAALCLAANGIKAYVFDDLRPTPELSFAVRRLGCIAGINITASHNPPEYNGYKVYWEDGAQVTPPHDKGIMDEVEAITDYSEVKTMSLEDAKAAGLYITIGEEIDDAYDEALQEQVLHKDAIDEVGEEMRIVYSPLHGTGNIPVRRVLSELGFTHVYVVPEQELPDGDFPTVSYPNPESPEAFVLGLALAHEVDADLVLATDPDADRLGVYVKDKDGEYHPLTGNMSGCLLADYEIGQKKALGILPEDSYLIKSIVTSQMANAIAASYGVGVIECLTGFKYIGQQILKMETTGKGHYAFGFEESYGCLIGTYARDKDAVAATMALCEAAAYYRTKDMTLWDAMIGLYEKFGYYNDSIETLTLKGMEGLEKTQKIMQTLREDPPKAIGDQPVLSFRDYEAGTTVNMETGEKTALTLPAANVVYFTMPDDAWVCVRPSGTEPKVKLYYSVKGTSLEDADQLSQKLLENLQQMIDVIL